MAFDTIPLAALARSPEITEVDIVRLGDVLRNDGPVTFAEALALTAIEGSKTPRHPSWRSFYIDAMLAHVLADTAPEGYIDVAKADRLIALAAPAGRIVTPGIFEMLTTVMSHARWVPERLTAVVLDEILCTVATGEGAVRHQGPDASAGAAVLTDTDADRIAHILYGASREGRRLSALEVRCVLALDAAASTSRVARWDELFVAALSDAALHASGYHGPTRDTVLAPGKVLSLSREEYLATYRPMSIEERSIDSLERQRIAIITGDEPVALDAAGLADQLADQQDTPAMRELAAAFAILGPVLHPRLQKFGKDRLSAMRFGARAA